MKEPVTDLFGDPIKPGQLMGKSTRRSGGYAARPGTGPKGQRCNTCAHMIRVGSEGRFAKCQMMAKVWTKSPGTDIKARAPACSYWERRPLRKFKFELADAPDQEVLL